MMKLQAKAPCFRLWILFLIAGLSMFIVPSLSSAFIVGDKYGGGVVFSVDETGKHGLIAAKADIQGHSAGLAEGHYTWADARAACENFESNGFRDWFLPNKEQLNQLFINRDAVGGFAVDYFGYWSVSEASVEDAWGQSFRTGFQDHVLKTAYDRVRAVRAF
jgi:hypothetical protein